MRAARANRVFETAEKRIRFKNTVMDKGKNALGFIQDRRSRADTLFIRTQSAIRAAGSPAAQEEPLPLAYAQEQ